MFLQQALNLVRGKARETEAEIAPVADRRADERRAVFREAVLTLEDYYTIRAVITDLCPGGARVAFSTRVDLPFRVRVAEPTLKLKCWARVVWQRDGAAGLEFQQDDA